MVRWVGVGGGIAITVLVAVFAGPGWAVLAGAVLLMLGAFFWRMGEVGAWERGWSGRLYGTPRDGGDDDDDVGSEIMRSGLRGRRRGKR
jgi:hypothetical protein